MKVKRRRALEVVGPNTKVEVATFYLTIHFYNLKRALQHVAHSDYPLGLLRGISRGISLLKERANGALSIELTTNNPNMRIIHRKGALILGQWVSEIRDDTRKPVYCALIKLLQEKDLCVRVGTSVNRTGELYSSELLTLIVESSDLNTIFDLVAHITEVIPYAKRLVQFFHKAEWGPIRHIRVIKERRSGISHGFAFVDFPSVGAAQTMMDRFVYEGLLVYDSKLFFEYRAEWGPIRHIRVIKERRSGISRGFAFVDFPSVGAAQTMMDRFVHEGLLVYDSKLFFEYSAFEDQAEWGPIRPIRVIRERRYGISHGFAFVDFPYVGAAQTMMYRFVHEGLLVYDSKLFFEYRVVDLEETDEASKETRSETHQAVALAIAAESICGGGFDEFWKFQ
ncbi:hypothetical protein OROMI_013326 [Orobanche minor]